MHALPSLVLIGMIQSQSAVAPTTTRVGFRIQRFSKLHFLVQRWPTYRHMSMSHGLPWCSRCWHSAALCKEAYNLPLKINPTQIAGGGQRNGLHCGSPSCTIANLNSFCQSPNYLTGAPGNGCKNANGPGNVATAGTRAFKNACPSSYSYSKNDTNTNPGVVVCLQPRQQLRGRLLPVKMESLGHQTSLVLYVLAK